MKIVLTGATGFLGRTLIEKLRGEQHELHILGRREVPGLPFSRWDSEKDDPPEAALANAGAVIHLVGEPVAQKWTPEVKKRIRDSRVAGTRRLVLALSTQSRRPSVLVAASAIGIYGSRGDEILTEKSDPGEGFLADVCKEWEHEASMAEVLGIRVVRLRTSVVLGKNGGALEKMLPPFRMGVGGRLSSGKQWMSWIHIDDMVNLIALAVREAKLTGALNASAPNPVRNADFTEVLAQVLHRPALFTVPAFALKMMYGEMADVLLASQRVIPETALSAGYRFQFPELAAALFDLLAR